MYTLCDAVFSARITCIYVTPKISCLEINTFGLVSDPETVATDQAHVTLGFAIARGARPGLQARQLNDAIANVHITRVSCASMRRFDGRDPILLFA